MKGFKRIHLKPKASATVTFNLAINQLGFYNADMKYVIEPGLFDVMIGGSSQDIAQVDQLDVVGEVVDASAKKVYFSEVFVK